MTHQVYEHNSETGRSIIRDSTQTEDLQMQHEKELVEKAASDGAAALKATQLTYERLQIIQPDITDLEVYRETINRIIRILKKETDPDI